MGARTRALAGGEPRPLGAAAAGERDGPGAHDEQRHLEHGLGRLGHTP